MDLFKLSILTCDEPLFFHYYNPLNKHIDKLFIINCIKGNYKIIKCLCETFKDENMNKAYNYCGFRGACIKGH